MFVTPVSIDKKGLELKYIKDLYFSYATYKSRPFLPSTDLKLDNNALLSLLQIWVWKGHLLDQK